MESYFENKVCWVTGASSGIGRATALQLASHGATVYISARRVALLEDIVKSYPALSLHSLPLDVLDYAKLESAREIILQRSGKIDLLIVSAGVYEPLEIEQLTAQSVKQVLETNLIGASNVVCCCLKTFISQGFGQIAGVASVVGYRALPKAAAYGASKAGLIYFLESIRLELQVRGISISVINPGFVKTQLTEKNKFSMPFMMEADKAATLIIRGLARKQAEIAFPWQLICMAKLARLLPNFIYNRLIASSVGI